MTLLLTSLPLARVFTVCLHSHSFPLRAEWQKSESSVDREPQGNRRWNSNSKHVVANSLSFSRPVARASRRACSQSDVFFCLQVDRPINEGGLTRGGGAYIFQARLGGGGNLRLGSIFVSLWPLETMYENH